MDKVRWGIIGCGDVTEVKSGPAFYKVDHSELVAVARRNGGLAEDYARRHGVEKWYDDATKLIDDPDVDAVYIATPPGSHAEYTLMAAAAGKPVYVEKPMARTHAECAEMIEACDKAGVKLYVAYYRRALPAFVKTKKLIEEGAIGEVRFVTTEFLKPPSIEDVDGPPRWRVLPEISGGGYFFDLGSHLLDYLDFLFGPIENVSGRVANQAGLYEPEDIVVATYDFQGGLQGSGVWCFTADPSSTIDSTKVVGDLGELTFATFDFRPVRLSTGEGVQEFDLPVPEHVQQPLIQSIVDDLRGVGSCPSTGLTAARTSKIIDRIVGRG
jgi:predicted dehydrogenase